MDFQPENELERLLMRAATEPEARVDFYRALIAHDLFVIDNSPAPREPVEGVLEEGSTLSLHVLEIEGTPHVPFFSSEQRIAQVVESDVKYVRLNGRALLEIVRGSHLVLDPGSDFGKQFVPEEIEAILDGSIFTAQDRFVLEEETKVLLGQPAEYPTHLTDALAALFKSSKHVKAAYLAQCVFPDEGDGSAHTVIGIDCSGDWEALLRQVRQTLGEHAKQGEVVDLIRIDGTGISQYMLEETRPFYRRKRFSLF